MRRLVAIALIAACSNEEGGVDFPIVPGGGGPGGSSRADAAIDPLDASTAIMGRVCLLATDLRTLGACSATGAGNLTVTLGTSSTTTAADGTFTVMRSANTAGLYWSVTGAGIRASAARFDETTTLHAFDELAYQQMIADNQAIENGSPGLVVRVTRGGAPVTGATVATDPAPVSEIYYDGATDQAWNLSGGTGTSGVAWIPSIAGTSARITITSGTIPTVLDDNALFTNTITFVYAEIP